jgi:hypothetical protein
VKFLGTIIKPNRIYIANRTKGNFYHALKKYNDMIIASPIDDEQLNYFVSCVNSYLGILKHYKTYRLRKRMLQKNMGGRWYVHVFVPSDKLKLVKRVRKC